MLHEPAASSCYNVADKLSRGVSEKWAVMSPPHFMAASSAVAGVVSPRIRERSLWAESQYAWHAVMAGPTSVHWTCFGYSVAVCIFGRRRVIHSPASCTTLRGSTSWLTPRPIAQAI